MTDKTVLIQKTITKNPAIRFNELKRKTDLQNGTITYILRKLLESGNIETCKYRDVPYYFPKGIEQKDMSILRFLTIPTPQRIILALVNGDACNVKELSERTEKSIGTVSIYKDRMVQEQVLQRHVGTGILYKISDLRLVKMLIKEYRNDLVAEMTKNLNDKIN